MGISDPKYRNSLAALLLGTPPSKSLTGLGLDLVSPPPAPTNALASALYAHSSPQPRSVLDPVTQPASVKRRVYFAFKFDDVMRVNNVRNVWKIDHPNNALMRSFCDSSIWEKREIEGDDSLKRLMREAIEYTSVVCVLVGENTWASRWVKYEIARSVIDGRGLLAVHINSLNHHRRGQPDPLGFNPLRLLGVYKSSEGKFYLYEKHRVVVNALTNQCEWRWMTYSDYTHPVPLPRYLMEPDVGYVQPLSVGAVEYDFVAGEGHKNIGAWIDHAARLAGK
jgi:MTH538 TIR-like domain (DUF1863)